MKVIVSATKYLDKAVAGTLRGRAECRSVWPTGGCLTRAYSTMRAAFRNLNSSPAAGVVLTAHS